MAFLRQCLAELRAASQNVDKKNRDRTYRPPVDQRELLEDLAALPDRKVEVVATIRECMYSTSKE